MANNAALYGARFQYSRGGPNEKVMRVRVASAYQASPGGVSVDLNVGDPIKKVNDGTIALCAAGDAIFGWVAGIGQYYSAAIGGIVPGGVSLPGGTTYGSVLERQSFVFITPAAGMVFEMDVDDNTTATTEAGYTALIGENCDITINQVSGDTHAYPLVDISDHKTGTAQLRIVDLARYIPQDYSGTRVKLLMTTNEVQEAPFQTTGV